MTDTPKPSSPLVLGALGLLAVGLAGLTFFLGYVAGGGGAHGVGYASGSMILPSLALLFGWQLGWKPVTTLQAACFTLFLSLFGNCSNLASSLNAPITEDDPRLAEAEVGCRDEAMLEFDLPDAWIETYCHCLMRELFVGRTFAEAQRLLADAENDPAAAAPLEASAEACASAANEAMAP